jgi:inhibitor of cysteine peptidase
MKTIFRTHLVIAASLALLTLLAACAENDPGSTPTPVPVASPSTAAPYPAGLAPVDSLEVLILESFPVQVNAIVKGHLPDACTHTGEIAQKRVENTFHIVIPAERPADAVCAQVLTPYEQTVRLDVRDLPKGTYIVDVNGVTKTFELAVDNTLNTPTP